MRTPSVHLNGTNKDELLAALMEAHDKLLEAKTAIQKTYPNARDYYPQGHGAIHEAVAEHGSRMDRIDSVIGELATIYLTTEDA